MSTLGKWQRGLNDTSPGLAAQRYVRGERPAPGVSAETRALPPGCQAGSYPSTEGPSMVDGSNTWSASSAVSTPSAMQTSRTVRFSLRAFCASFAARS